MAPSLKTPSFVGLTSTIPVEVIFAAGLTPVDLNNLFISADVPEQLVRGAESSGFSHNICAWIKGIYSATLSQDVKTIVAVFGGDCSHTVALAEVLERRGVRVIPFHYPLDRDKKFLERQIDGLRRSLSATWDDVYRAKSELDRIRSKLHELDRLTYRENVISGWENHFYLVSSSDFNSDPDVFEGNLDAFLREARQREPRGEEIRLGYLGVPPILGELYETVESFGGRVVFNETQRQFSMPYRDDDITSVYLNYTYPYDIGGRLEDIREAIRVRSLDGLIHYTQTFCFRQIYDIILRESLPLPILTLEGDRPGKIDGRTAFRLEAFIEMLKGRKSD
ncbi:2-hydroxyacyl-CoA dehydratase family protein [Thermodesulfobacteriota bacterium]